MPPAVAAKSIWSANERAGSNGFAYRHQCKTSEFGIVGEGSSPIRPMPEIIITGVAIR